MHTCIYALCANVFKNTNRIYMCNDDITFCIRSMQNVNLLKYFHHLSDFQTKLSICQCAWMWNGIDGLKIYICSHYVGSSSKFLINKTWIWIKILTGFIKTYMYPLLWLKNCVISSHNGQILYCNTSGIWCTILSRKQSALVLM